VFLHQQAGHGGERSPAEFNFHNFAPPFTEGLSQELTLMLINVLKSKIHRVKVTQAELHYVGSITIDEDLLDAANMIENEKVQIVNINNGERFETYIIKGERGTGTICLNGPAARKVQVGDLIIVISYATMDFEEAKRFKPSIIFPDAANRLV
jgi:aspartate 1-decarboxylase